MIVFLLTWLHGKTQDTARNKYGLWVIGNSTVFQKLVKKNPQKKMVDLKLQIPAIMVDLKYSTANNFLHRQLYPALQTTYLRQAAADALSGVQKELSAYGLGLKLFDAYRPYSITEQMWEQVKDDRYAADPRKGSGHNRGIAVDLTLVDLVTRKELDMGTGFDNFSDTAHHDFIALPDKIKANRALLRKVMEHAGFKALDTEWWHYALPNGKDFELLDLGFDQLKKITSKK